MYPTLKQYTDKRKTELANKHGVTKAEASRDFTGDWCDYIYRMWEEHGTVPTLRQWNALPAYLKHRLRRSPRNLRSTPAPLGHLPYSTQAIER